MLPQTGLLVSETAQLGDPLIAVVMDRTEPVRTVRPAAPAYPTDQIDTLLLLQRLEHLDRRVTLLEQQTLAAYWSRFVLWCQSIWWRIRGTR